jgi:hypothetical protein
VRLQHQLVLPRQRLGRPDEVEERLLLDADERLLLPDLGL